MNELFLKCAFFEMVRKDYLQIEKYFTISRKYLDFFLIFHGETLMAEPSLLFKFTSQSLLIDDSNMPHVAELSGLVHIHLE